MAAMRAVVIHRPGDPAVLQLEIRLILTSFPDDVLIRIGAIGFNRSKTFTRQGHCPGIVFPCILGIEAVGKIATHPSCLRPLRAKTTIRPALLWQLL
jgi:NADPH:quinone reductase-like Zn-dependent oxidoreductase